MLKRSAGDSQAVIDAKTDRILGAPLLRGFPRSHQHGENGDGRRTVLALCDAVYAPDDDGSAERSVLKYLLKYFARLFSKQERPLFQKQAFFF